MAKSEETVGILILWMAAYENWIVETEGIEYRQECVASWLAPFVYAENMEKSWRFLSERRWEKKQQPLRQQLKQFTIK